MSRSDWTALTGVLISTVTLYLVFKQGRWALRNAPYVELSLHALGHARNVETGEVVSHMWELVNEGTADARLEILHGVGCELEYSDTFPPVRVLKAGLSQRLMVKPCDETAAWALICWTSLAAPQWQCVEWLAPGPGPELAAALDAAHAPTQRWLRFVHPMRLRRRLYTVRAVGPGGAAKECVRTGTPRVGRQLLTAMSLAVPDQTLAKLESLLPELIARSRPGSPGGTNRS